MLNDLLTLTKIREGDIKAFEDVFRRYYSPLCWYAMSITGSMEAAEEIVEELFYGFWKEFLHVWKEKPSPITMEKRIAVLSILRLQDVAVLIETTFHFCE